MINGHRIRQVRELRGLTQADFAESINVTQATIAYIEGGRSQPSDEHLNTIALKTGFPPSFFRQEADVNFPLGSLLFRARTSISSGERQQAYRYAQVLFEMAEKLTQKVDWKPTRLPRLTETPSDAARLTRSALGLSPDTPIENLINTIEKIGVLVLSVPVPLEGRDAFSGWAGSEEQRPVIVMSKVTFGDRLRHSVAHELGHLVLHQALITNQTQKGNLAELELQAHQFASELLMPEVTMRQEITTPVTLSSLASLKKTWKVSIQSLIRRAYDLAIITERQYRYLFHQLSAAGWKVEEPVKIPIEKPRVIRKIAEMLFGNPINYQKLANEVSLSPQFVKQVMDAHLGKDEMAGKSIKSVASLDQTSLSDTLARLPKVVGLSEDLRRTVWERDEGRCCNCGNSDFLEFVHIVPFVKGGENTVDNIQLICRNCNKIKQGRSQEGNGA